MPPQPSGRAVPPLFTFPVSGETRVPTLGSSQQHMLPQGPGNTPPPNLPPDGGIPTVTALGDA